MKDFHAESCRRFESWLVVWGEVGWGWCSALAQLSTVKLSCIKYYCLDSVLVIVKEYMWSQDSAVIVVTVLYSG